MFLRDSRRVLTRCAAVAVLSVSLGATLLHAAPAYADLESDLASAQAQLESIGAEYAQLQEDLADAARELEIIKGEIEETETQLQESQKTLAQSAADDYKGGGGQLLDVVLGASSFDDLVSRVYYANKVSDAQAEAIEHVQTLKADLEQSQAQQEQEIAAMEQKVSEVQQNQTDAQALVNSLSEEMREQLAAEAAQNEQLAAGMQSAEDGSASTSDRPVVTPPASDTTDDSTPAPTPTPGPDPVPDTGGSDTGNSGGGSSSGTSSVGSAALQYAFTQAGAPYVYGAADPSVGFDCSGIVSWSYAQIGVYMPHSSSAQREYVMNNGRYTTDISQLQYGDLVFYPGHVAFYVGGGQIYGAWNYGRGIGYGSIYDCGTPLGGGNI
ncbi:C40 family peptidase [uncultured Enorma sp.]|uniref:C40 family peptidase n=1 Tax=uncultured Enorma sp. TaxID=1714346 RepID=UPI002593158C|nr:C40 family peptidase [uncultured Enorma sp.]